MRQKEAQARMMVELERLQTEFANNWIDQSLPAGWQGMDYDDPVKPATTRITIRLDADLVRWFRKMGPGYTGRINQVLRVYYHALQSGQIHGYPTDNPLPRIRVEANDLLERIEQRRRAREDEYGPD